MLDILKTKITLVAATLGLIITIGGAFTWYGEINTRLSNIEKNMGSDTSGASISQNVSYTSSSIPLTISLQSIFVSPNS